MSLITKIIVKNYYVFDCCTNITVIRKNLCRDFSIDITEIDISVDCLIICILKPDILKREEKFFLVFIFSVIAIGLTIKILLF